MINLGLSVTSHYRILNNSKDIELLLYNFSKQLNINLIEIGFNGFDNYDMYFQAYLNSSSVLEKINLNIHLPRKDWQIIGINKIVSDVNYLCHIYKVKNLIIHIYEYIKYFDTLKEFNNKNILLENPHFEDMDKIFTLEKLKHNLCLDVNNFYDINFRFHTDLLSEFLSKYKNQIKEIHFSNNNHETFDVDNFDFMRNIIKKLHDNEYIFEGTYKKAKNINELIIDLKKNLCLFNNLFFN